MSEEMKRQLFSELSQAEYIHLSTDAWSANKKSYAGYTASWYDNELNRKNAVLACRRILGRHTFDVIAKEINGILTEWG